jgi:Flp pilus assembly protein TadD
VVLNVEPGHVDALVGIAELALAEGNLPVAGDRVSAAIAADRQSAQAWIARGQLEVARNRFEHAEAVFRKAAELNPDSARATIALARILLSLG